MPSGYPNNGKPNKGWFKKGQNLSKAHKKKISEGVKKHLPKTAFKKGQRAWNKGRKSPWAKNNPQTFRNGHIPSHKGKKLPQFQGKNSCHWKGGKVNRNGYIMIYQPRHSFSDKRKYIFEHRLIIEKQIERCLLPSETTHHLGTKNDNRPQMLMAFVNNSVHKRFHKNPQSVKPSEIIFDGRKFIP